MPTLGGYPLIRLQKEIDVCETVVRGDLWLVVPSYLHKILSPNVLLSTYLMQQTITFFQEAINVWLVQFREVWYVWYNNVPDFVSILSNDHSKITYM